MKSIETIKVLLKTELSSENEVFQTEIKEAFINIVKNKIVENEDFIKDRSLDFCKKQVLTCSFHIYYIPFKTTLQLLTKQKQARQTKYTKTYFKGSH